MKAWQPPIIIFFMVFHYPSVILSKVVMIGHLLVCFMRVQTFSLQRFLMNLRSKVSLCADTLRWDSSGVGISMHQIFNVGLFSEAINHRILKHGLMVVCDRAFQKCIVWLPLTKVRGHKETSLVQKRPKNFNVALFSATIEQRNLKLARMIVCNEGFPKMLSLITSRKGQRS